MLQEDKHILWRASALCLGMALPSMLIGKSVMYVLLVLGICAGLMATKDESLRATVRMVLDSWLSLLVLLLMGALLTGVAMGINPAYAFMQWTEMALLLLFGGTALFMTLREMPGRHVELLMKVLVISTMTAAVLAMFDAFVHEPRLSAMMHGDGMSRSPYRLNFISSILAVIVPFVWARMLIKSREGEPFAVRVAPWVTAFSFMAVIVCGGRSGWIAMLVAALLFAAMISRYHGFVIHKKHWLAGAALIMVSLGLYAFSFGLDFMLARTTLAGEADIGRGMLSGRLEIWEKSVQGFLQAPLFGIGVMNYRNLPGAIDPHPHNILLQMLLEGGLVTFVMFCALVGVLVFRFVNLAKGNIYGVAALASTVAFLTSSMAHSSIFHGWWFCFFLFLSMLGWRAGWGGSELKKRRRASVVVKPTSYGR